MLWYKSGTGYPISMEHLSTHPDRFMIFCFLKKSFSSEPVSLLVTSRFFSLRCSSISSKQLKPSDGLKCFSLPWPSRLFSDRLQRAQYFSILKHNRTQNFNNWARHSFIMSHHMKTIICKQHSKISPFPAHGNRLK